MSFTFSGFSPSTPNRSKRSLFAQQQSTTPRVPPPSHLDDPSTTPLGPPPRSIFGSSQNIASRGTYGIKGSARRGFHVPNSSPPTATHEGQEDDEDDDADEPYSDDADAPAEDGYDDHDAIMDAGMESPGKSAFMSSVMSSARGLKRSRNGVVREQRESNMAALARGLARQAQKQSLQEPDELVIEQEEIMVALDADFQKKPGDRETLLSVYVARLTELWRQFANNKTREAGIGPAAKDGVAQANYLSSLLFQLHHPHLSSTRPSRNQQSFSLVKRSAECSVPRALLDWLDTYHNPFPDEFEAIHRHRPSPADNERFWDNVYASIIRGKFSQAIALLRDAGWDHAITAVDDFPQVQPEGYSGRQLENVETVVDACLQVMSTCPALTDDDWDVRGPDWTVFRQHVRLALRDLENFAGAEERDEIDGHRSNMFQRSSRGGEYDQYSISAASRRAESKVPWSVYENLKAVYGLLVGGVDELLDSSQDWLEGTLYLTIWWDGEEEDTAKARKSVGPNQKPREVDVSPLTAYRRRLADAFDLVSTDEELDTVFQVNTVDAVQVALACIMEDKVDEAISLIQTCSAVLTTAVVEVASLGTWLPLGRPRSAGLLQQGFSSEDLMVLSHGPGAQSRPTGQIDRDDILRTYADLLGKKQQFSGADGRLRREGWELAVSVLGRLDDTSSAQDIIGSMLDNIELADEDRVDRILNACSDLNLIEQSRGIAERYADKLASSNESFGTVLIFYARARAAAKLQSTLALLINMCLVQSAAIPAQAALDPSMASLLSRDRSGLVQLASADGEAATLLSSHISGYATVRRFYDLRDHNGASTELLQPIERQREAAKALMAAIESASDCIRGGLFDPSVVSVVPVDGLIALLGEALPLLGHDRRVFGRDQVFVLLRIAEDLATAPQRIRENAELLLHAAVNARHQAAGSDGTKPTTRASKRHAPNSQSGVLSASTSSYDMLASASLTLNQSRSGNTAASDGIALSRAWDWRKGLDGVPGGIEVGFAEVLLLFRTALAQEVARGWSGMVEW